MPDVSEVYTDCDRVCSTDNRAEWLAARRHGIGSSDAASILGISPFKSALAVYVDKVTEGVESEESEAMKWGKLLEPLVASEFSMETKRRVALASSLVRHRERPWQLATLDAEQVDLNRQTPGVLEIKATGWRGGDWREGVPDHVMAQAQHQLSVTGCKWGSVAVVVNGCKLLWADFERDERFIEEILLPAETEFWRRVTEGVPVQPDGSESARAALKALFPTPTIGEVVALPGEFIDLDKELVALKEDVKNRKLRIETIEQDLIAQIGTAEIGTLLNGVEYSYRKQTRPERLAKYVEFRVLRRHAHKGDK